MFGGRAVNRFDAWLLAPAPARRLACLRVLVTGYATIFVVARWSSFWSGASLPARQLEGVGVLWWLDTRPAPTLMRTLIVVTVVVGVLATLGIAYRVTGPGFAALFLTVSTYRLSFGHVIHTEHLVALHLLVIGFTRAADTLTCCRPPSPPNSEVYGWPVKVMSLITVVAYMLAGWAKIHHGGLDWVFGDVLRNQVAYDNLRKMLLGSSHSPIGARIVEFGWLFPPFAALTVAVELLAFVVLLGRTRLTALWVAAAWAFHVGIALTMAISFPYQLSLVAYAPLLPVERLASRVAHTLRISTR